MKLTSFIFLLIILSSCSNDDVIEHKARVRKTSTKSELKPMVVIHDGPGLNFNYIMSHLEPLKSKRKLVFYDQLNCYYRKCATKPVEISDLVKQLENFTNQYGNNYGVLAHGWGSILLMEHLLNSPKNIHPDEVIFVTPAPLEWTKMVLDSNKNSKKYSKEEIKQLAQVTNPNQCLDAIRISTKHALHDKASAKKLNFDRYDCILAEYLMGKLTNYNYEPFTYLLPEKTLWVTGESDFYTLPINSQKNVVIKKSGHYPFAENNEDFIKTVNAFLD